MPTYSELSEELRNHGITHDGLRRKYLRILHEKTNRNIISYYSGWLQKSHLPAPSNVFPVTDLDKNGFMATVHGLDRTKGLDLLLHTPGGSAAATESLVNYLRSMFDRDIRVIVPQLALSAGTMIACASREIVMGKQSSLGPIDPQISGMAAHGIIEEFNEARKDIVDNPKTQLLWASVLAKYPPTLVGECVKAMAWARTMVHDWLVDGMFKDQKDAADSASKVIRELADHSLTLSHDRHISAKRAAEIGLKITALEDDNDLQDAVLSVHHANMLSLMETAAAKIIENHLGKAVVMQLAPRT
jgi:membrane-bound ClpP family serine protease